MRRRPLAAMRRAPAGARAVATEWQTFVRPPYRPFAGLAIAQGLVVALTGPALIVPLLLDVGVGAGPAMLVASLVLVGPAVQLAVPELLRRSDGDLRRLTILAALMGETRGLWLAVVAVLATSGIVPVGVLIGALAVALAVAGLGSGMAAANLQAWFGAVLTEPERRFVGPRVAGLALATGAVVLLPVAALLAGPAHDAGLLPYAAAFAVAGITGSMEVRLIARRLPRPGRVVVPARRAASMIDPGPMSNFLQTATLAALGSGLAPYLSVYAMVVLSAPVSVGVVFGAIGSGVSVLTATLVAVGLAERSASRFLRGSYVVIGLGWLLTLAAVPGSPAAGLFLVATAVVATAGAAIAQLAMTERLFRLAPGPAAISAQGRFVASTAAALTVGQLIGAVLLSVGPPGYPTFAALIVVTAALRLVAAMRLRVAPSWSSVTGVFSLEELGSRQV